MYVYTYTAINCSFFFFENSKILYKICRETVIDVNIFSQSTLYLRVQVASLSKFEYKCIHQPRRNNVVNYSSKTRLRRRSIRQFYAHNTRWILQLAAIAAVIDRIVSNDRVVDYGICEYSCTRASMHAHTSANCIHVSSRHDQKHYTTRSARERPTYTGIP